MQTSHKKCDNANFMRNIFIKMNNFGKRLRELREQKGLKLKEIAVLLGKSERNNTTISAWENEKTEPSMSEIIKLADILGTSVEYLVTGSYESSANSIEEPRTDYVPREKYDKVLERLNEFLEKENAQLKNAPAISN